jgi:putative transcription factor
MATFHNDWDPVVLKKPKPPPKAPSRPKVESEDVGKIQTTTLELRNQIQSARIAKKLSQAQLAQQINEKPNVIQGYESGKAIPTTQVLQKLRRVLGVKLTSPPKAT